MNELSISKRTYIQEYVVEDTFIHSCRFVNLTMYKTKFLSL